MQRLPARAAAALRQMPPWLVLVVTAAFWAAVLGVVALGRYGGDVRAFVCLGEERIHPEALAGIPRSSEHGYDGQYYAILAGDPLLLRPETAACLDAPYYRAGRIGLPLAAWLLALGRPGLAVLLYQLLCWGGGLAAVYLAARWLDAEGRPAAWALLLAVSAGLATSMFRSTPDGAAVALILAALWLHRRERPLAVVVILVAATLVRETSLLAAAALCFVELRRQRWRSAAASIALPLLAFSGWQLGLRLLIGAGRDHHVGGNFGLPLEWLPGKLVRLAEMGLPAARMEVAGLLALAACFAALVSVALRWRRWSAPEAVFAAFGLLGLVLAGPVYVEAYAYARVLLVLPFLALLIAFRAVRRSERWVLLAVPILFAATGAFVVRGELGLTTARSVARTFADGPPAADAAAPAMPAVSYLLPAVRAAGHAGAEWRSELELENLSDEPATLRIELLLAGADTASPPSVGIALEPYELHRVADVLGELFDREGFGALRVVGEGGNATARIRTRDAAGSVPPAAFIDAVPAPRPSAVGAAVELPGIANNPNGSERTLTGLALANLSKAPIDLELTVVDGMGAVLGARQLRLAAREVRQVKNVFAAVGVSARAEGSARVASPSFGAAFLAHATVVRREPPGIVHVLPVVPSRTDDADQITP